MSAPGVDELARGVLAGDRTALGRAITLVESAAEDKRAQALDLLRALPAPRESTLRVGITGVPGVGKSTFIDALGMYLVERGKRVCVLAVDPTSARTGGSILGDKTRMARLARDERAFIRPSPSSGTLGGVARKTHETIQLCEAAGFDTVLVETVGVGQSETVVEGMVDVFLVLMLAGAGDELQGIKRGILELADLIAINKADGANVDAAAAARLEYEGALRLLRPKSPSWTPRAVCVSALRGTGLAELWALVEEHHAALGASGELAARRSEQLGRWMWELVEQALLRRLREHAGVRALAERLERDVRAGAVPPEVAAAELLAAFR
ncbi:MAG: methylmalonyl Co-A mutase-associated GTPase MeaB [Planctomycetes bacterium]|nr:methylmalonyl Co-A mutase-associated GTPase MeaB [Planctomycetota bacterium]